MMAVTGIVWQSQKPQQKSHSRGLLLSTAASPAFGVSALPESQAGVSSESALTGVSSSAARSGAA